METKKKASAYVHQSCVERYTIEFAPKRDRCVQDGQVFVAPNEHVLWRWYAFVQVLEQGRTAVLQEETSKYHDKVSFDCDSVMESTASRQTFGIVQDFIFRRNTHRGSSLPYFLAALSERRFR